MNERLKLEIDGAIEAAQELLDRVLLLQEWVELATQDVPDDVDEMERPFSDALTVLGWHDLARALAEFALL